MFHTNSLKFLRILYSAYLYFLCTDDVAEKVLMIFRYYLNKSNQTRFTFR